MTHYESDRTDSARERRWRLFSWGLLILAALAAAGILSAVTMFSRWSEVRTLSSAEADREFTTVLARSGGGIPYVEITPGGEVIVHREQEKGEATPLGTLHLLAWEPAGGRLVRIGFPFWFVRLKMTDTINLGTLTTVLTEDWKNLNLKISVEDLERRGPAVIIDHTLDEGGRILLWTARRPKPLDESPD